MSFETEIDALGVAELHAKRVRSLEDDREKALIEVYQRVATSLRKRLRRVPKDSFTAQQIRVTLLQLEAALITFEKELTDEAGLGARLLSERAVRDLVKEVNKFNDYFSGAVQLVDLDAQLSAADYDQRLINNYKVSISTYSNELRRSIATNLQTLITERVPSEEIHRRMVEEDGIGRFFEGESWRLRRIVRTELHGIYGQSKLATLGRIVNDEPEMRKALYHPMDARTGDDSKYIEMLQQNDADGEGTDRGRRYVLRPRVQDPFEYTWQDKKKGRKYRRIFMAPPDRPNDRAILIPFHPSWDTE